MPRKKRTVDQLAQRRARLERQFRDKNAAALFQRWLADQSQRAAAVEARERETAGQAEAARNANPANTDAQKNRAEPEVTGDAASSKEGVDSQHSLRDFLSSEPPWSAKASDSATWSAAGPRNAGPQNQIPFSGPEHNEIARLQARARAEMQRADFVTALLEEVLGTSTARILKHQARLEAMQAQLNALQGR